MPPWTPNGATFSSSDGGDDGQAHHAADEKDREQVGDAHDLRRQQDLADGCPGHEEDDAGRGQGRDDETSPGKQGRRQRAAKVRLDLVRLGLGKALSIRCRERGLRRPFAVFTIWNADLHQGSRGSGNASSDGHVRDRGVISHRRGAMPPSRNRQRPCRNLLRSAGVVAAKRRP